MPELGIITDQQTHSRDLEQESYDLILDVYWAKPLPDREQVESPTKEDKEDHLAAWMRHYIETDSRKYADALDAMITPHRDAVEDAISQVNGE